MLKSDFIPTNMAKKTNSRASGLIAAKKKKTNTAWKTTRGEAQKCRWHLEPPLRDHFDRDHWWKSASKPWAEIPIIAAMWEVLRRHPNVERCLSADTDWKSHLEIFLGTHALKSWPKLSRSQQQEWREALVDLPPQHGFDPRPVYSVTQQSVDIQSGAPAQAVIAEDKKLEKLSRRKPQVRQILEQAKRIREVTIARMAVEHHQTGRILIAVNPDISDIDDVMTAVKACIKHHQHKVRHGTERRHAWLQAISDFENDVLCTGAKQILDAMIFTRYRRILNRWTWPLKIQGD